MVYREKCGWGRAVAPPGRRAAGAARGVGIRTGNAGLSRTIGAMRPAGPSGGLHADRSFSRTPSQRPTGGRQVPERRPV